MKNLKKYGAAAAAGLVAATLIGGCGDTKEAPASEGSTKSGLTQYNPPCFPHGISPHSHG